jgi:hypothetical protein
MISETVWRATQSYLRPCPPMPTYHHLPTMYRGNAAGAPPPATSTSISNLQAPTQACTHRQMAYAGPGARPPRQRQGMGDGRWKVRSQKVFCARCEWPSYHLVVHVLVASVLVRFLVCLLRSLVVLLGGGPGGPGWQSCWSLSFPPPLRPLSSNPSLPPVLLRAPVPAKALQCYVLSQRFGVIWLSFHFHHGPSAASLVVLLLPPLPPPVCLPVLVRLSVGQREASTGAMCIQ